MPSPLELLSRVPIFLEEKGIHYPIFTTDEASISRIFSRGEVVLPTSALLDDRGHVLEIFSGWSEESRAAILRLAGAASAQGRRIRE